MSDRLSLATNVRKARKTSPCPQCGRWISVGEMIARLTDPPGWCHLRCVPAVRQALNITEEEDDRP